MDRRNTRKTCSLESIIQICGKRATYYSHEWRITIHNVCNRFYIVQIADCRSWSALGNNEETRSGILFLHCPSTTTWTPLVQSKSWIKVEEHQIIERKKSKYHAKHGEHGSYRLQAPYRPKRGGHYGENSQVPIQMSPLTVTPSGHGKSVTVTRLSL